MSQAEKAKEISRLRSNGLYWLRVAEIYKSNESCCLIYLKWAAEAFDEMDKIRNEARQ